MVDFVTTFNKNIYNEYSKNLVNSFIEKSDDSVRLNIFYEGNFEAIKEKYNQNNKIRFYEFNSEDWNVFYNKFGHLVEANGFKLIHNKENNKITVMVQVINGMQLSFHLRCFQYIWLLN